MKQENRKRALSLSSVNAAEEAEEGVLEGEALEVEEACRPILQWPSMAELELREYDCSSWVAWALADKVGTCGKDRPAGKD